MRKLGEHEHICCVCGKITKYCHICGVYNPKQTWRYVYCSENCREIFNTCSSYVGKKITISEAYEKLSKLDLSNIKNIEKGIRKNIEEILAFVPERKKNKKKTKSRFTNENIVNEFIADEPTVDEIIEPTENTEE